MAKHSPHIIKGAPYIPFELYEEHLARKDAALGMAIKCLEDADDGVDYKHLLMREAALAACREAMGEA